MKSVILLLALALPEVVWAQQYNEAGIPIAQGVNDGVVRQSQRGAQTCIDAEHDLDQRVEEINGELYGLETKSQSGYFVRHSDRQAIVSLIQRELTPYRDQIHHAIFLGNGKFCLDKLQAGVTLANSIYQANLQYRKNGR
jgi:hypothetical protein